MSDSIVHLDERPDCPACSGPMVLPHIVPERSGGNLWFVAHPQVWRYAQH
jgi:hypothetical protein